jgi:hypothetical protein
MPSATSHPLSEDSFMKSCYYVALAPLLLVITPVAADMYCDMNTTTGGGR